jgi:hypothetical protein
MKRTVRLSTLPLNRAKRDNLGVVVCQQTQSKRVFVLLLRSPLLWYLLDNKQNYRNWLKANGYYPAGTNVHLLDQAAFEAVDTCVRYIASCIERANLKLSIWNKFTNESERHYAYACLIRHEVLGEIMRGQVPKLSAGHLDHHQQEVIARWLHRCLRNALDNTWPTITSLGSLTLDESSYRSFTLDQRQYVSVIGPNPRCRIVLPLSGVSKVSGNIRVILDQDLDRAFIHVSYGIKQLSVATGKPVAIDWGITEVATDSNGIKHGTSYGTTLVLATERRNKTGRSRGKLHAISKKDAGSKRTRHIAKNNLGTKKLNRNTNKTRAALRTISGEAIKELLYGAGNRTRARGRLYQSSTQRPSTVVTEDLSRLRGKAKSKKTSRLCSSWARDEHKARITVLAYV